MHDGIPSLPAESKGASRGGTYSRPADSHGRGDQPIRRIVWTAGLVLNAPPNVDVFDQKIISSKSVFVDEHHVVGIDQIESGKCVVVPALGEFLARPFIFNRHVVERGEDEEIAVGDVGFEV